MGKGAPGESSSVAPPSVPEPGSEPAPESDAAGEVEAKHDPTIERRRVVERATRKVTGGCYVAGLAAAVAFAFGKYHSSLAPYVGPALAAMALAYQVNGDQFALASRNSDDSHPSLSGTWAEPLGVVVGAVAFVLLAGGAALLVAPMSASILGQSVLTAPPRSCRLAAISFPPRRVVTVDPITGKRTSV